MLIGIQDEIMRLSQLGLLEPLLRDQTTGRNILWTTDAYTELGRAYAKNAEITPDLIIGEHSGVIRNRARKDLELQSDRTKSHAEVFTPIWVCNRMIDSALAESDQSPRKKRKDDFIQTRWLEITCGEAPFLVQRYDVLTGEIIPIEQRKGILDRKLQWIRSKVSHAGGDLEGAMWLKQAIRAFQSVYGYELQGDNLLIARLNLYMTFEEYLEYIYHRKPTRKESLKIVDIITWNLWQMDGLTHMTPCSEDPASPQRSLFDFMGISDKPKETPKPCQIRFHINARKILSFTLTQLAEQGDQAMKFDYIIGNPPYQDQSLGDNATFFPQIYDKFMNESYKLGNIVELIHPARFLFNAGSTSKAWNRQMLDDNHFKVLKYYANSKEVFKNTDIKGGIAITIRNQSVDYGKIDVFTAFNELNTILHKVESIKPFKSFSSIVVTSYAYHFTDRLHKEHPNVISILSKGHEYDLKSNVLEKLQDIITDCPPLSNSDSVYVRILGIKNKKRAYGYINKDYLKVVDNFYKYKIFVPAANGSGAIGEVLSTPLIGEPLMGATETFMSIGCFEQKNECEACLKYIKSKFLRVLLGILKTTQHNPVESWRLIPLQDFTENSDIDWTKSIPEIDQQLYKKYGLDKDEIEFIETHVKAMT
ncbi:MAG: Eco57I restriction-modification methylase domain-containing protein [Proteobacteria bacterium]|nr:Eco57I restriction-modification methylase domain-containing protein [Pseudomonadota bacterium]